MSVFVIAVAGPSSSGKTTLTSALASRLRDRYGEHSVALLTQDSYYRDQSHLPESQRLSVNYDHPSAIDFALLAKHIRQLKAGQAVDRPTFDYISCSRTRATTRVKPAPVIVVEGILVLADEQVRGTADLKVYVETPLDICFIRRARKYMSEWGRSFDSVVTQFESKVRPMFLEAIEPSKYHADLIILGEKDTEAAVEMLQVHAAQWIRRTPAAAHI